MKKHLFCATLVAGALASCGTENPQLGKASLDEVVNAMTLEEKAHLIIGTGMAGFSGDSAVIGETRKLVCVSIRLVKEILPLIIVHTSR